MTGKALALTAALIACASPASAADVDGFWRGPIRNVVVHVEACGEAICGYIITSDRLKVIPDLKDEKNKDAKLRTRPVKGLALFYDLKGGPPKWSGGSIYNPDDGNTYKGSVELVANDTLVLKGCALVILCKSQKWVRLPNADAAPADNR